MPWQKHGIAQMHRFANLVAIDTTDGELPGTIPTNEWLH